jgi:hypothetical protein
MFPMESTNCHNIRIYRVISEINSVDSSVDEASSSVSSNINVDNNIFVESKESSVESKESNFVDLNNKLNYTKSKLDVIPKDKYGYIARKLDVYNSIIKTIYTKYKMQVVTNASLKMYEIINQMKLINTNTLNVFCNAELPGSFIVTINHYLKTMFDKPILRWLANSYLDGLDDRYGIYKYNKDNWIMNENMNGDITSKDNLLYIVETVCNKFPKGVNLYTSDVGKHISDYNKEEVESLDTNYCQILIGLMTLSKGGCMVTKQFTFFTPFNRSLITLLSSLFEELFITKPATSRPINSEIYIVGKRFLGIDVELCKYLISRIDCIDGNIPLINNLLDSQLFNISKEIYSVQIQTIEYAYDIFCTGKIREFNPDYSKEHDKWLEVNPIKPIHSKDYIKMT